MRRRSDAPRVRLADLRVDEELALTLPGWTPGAPSSTVRWSSWSEYLATYAIVRDELRARTAARTDDAEPWGEQVHRFADEHGLAALEAASYDDLDPPDEEHEAHDEATE